jgi:dCTP deaminase
MGVLADWQIKDHVTINPFQETQQTDGRISSGLSSYGYDLRVGYKFKVFTPTFSTVVDPKAFDERAFVDIDVTPRRHMWKQPEEIRNHVENWYCNRCEQQCFDPKSFTKKCLEGPDHILIPPNSFALGETVERVKIPRDVIALCACKSTYARVGIVIPTTILEPEWEGIVTLEIANTTPLPAKVYAGEGICQVLFFRSDGHSEAVLDAVRRLCSQQAQAVAGYATVRGDQTFRYFLQMIEERLHEALPRGTCRVSYADRKGRYNDQKGLTLPFVEKQP